MDKTQFIEKTIKEIKNSKFITALAITLPSDVYDVFLKMLEGVLDSKLSECWDMAGEEERNSIAEKYGDFRVVRKWGLGLVKYGKALRFFLLPHTKHKEGDDDTQF